MLEAAGAMGRVRTCMNVVRPPCSHACARALLPGTPMRGLMSASRTRTCVAKVLAWLLARAPQTGVDGVDHRRAIYSLFFDPLAAPAIASRWIPCTERPLAARPGGRADGRTRVIEISPPAKKELGAMFI